MAIKAKFIGLIIIIVGVLPVLTKINAIGEVITKYPFLESITPGSIIYQAIIILLGIVLVLKLRPNVAIGATR